MPDRQEEEQPLDLSQIQILSRLSPEEIEILRSYVEEISYPEGARIFSRGDQGDTMFLIRSGMVRIELPLSDARSHHLVTFGRGDFFGDMAFLDNAPRSADANTGSPCSLYSLSRKRFNEVVKTAPHVSEQVFLGLSLILADRLRQADVEIRVLGET
jgi:SulP family sulfate permease